MSLPEERSTRPPLRLPDEHILWPRHERILFILPPRRLAPRWSVGWGWRIPRPGPRRFRSQCTWRRRFAAGAQMTGGRHENERAVTVAALLEEEREHIFHAAMFDPHTAAELDVKQIRAMTEDMLVAHRDWLPGWTQ